jgi:hypothetical protein
LSGATLNPLHAELVVERAMTTLGIAKDEAAILVADATADLDRSASEVAV